jgi:hypothetical protein
MTFRIKLRIVSTCVFSRDFDCSSAQYTQTVASCILWPAWLCRQIVAHASGAQHMETTAQRICVELGIAGRWTFCYQKYCLSGMLLV